MEQSSPSLNRNQIHPDLCTLRALAAGGTLNSEQRSALLHALSFIDAMTESYRQIRLHTHPRFSTEELLDEIALASNSFPASDGAELKEWDRDDEWAEDNADSVE